MFLEILKVRIRGNLSIGNFQAAYFFALCLKNLGKQKHLYKRISSVAEIFHT
jgi:hypothetical protein